jgi:RNA polymerase sigma factor (sigma-70 family)
MAFAEDSVEWILNRSHLYPLLTAEQEIQYSRQVQAWLPLRDKPNPTKREQAVIRRGKRAYDAFFVSNIRLVMRIAQKYVRIGGTLAIEDLMQEGMIGLQRAIVKFDATRGYKFSTYSFSWIQQAITRAIEQKSRTIRLPSNAMLVLYRAMKFMAEHEMLHGKLPSLAAVAEVCGVQEVTLRNYLGHKDQILSLDHQTNNGGEDGRSSTIVEMLPDTSVDPDPYLEGVDNVLEVLPELIDGLSSAEQLVIRERYMSSNRRSPSYGSIAEQLGISRQATQQTHNKAMNKLRLRINAAARPPGTPALQCAA